MGTFIHHALVVTCWERKAVEAAHAKAAELFPGSILTPIMGVVANSGASFAIVPDGSKEGWPQSDEMDAARSAFIEWLRTPESRYVDWIEVEFGGDLYRASITAHGDDDVE